MGEERGSSVNIGIYAPKPNMGNSTLARELASYAAAADRKVLLVELDYHYPSTAVEWGMSDAERCLECAITGCLESSDWRLEHYLLPHQHRRHEQTALPQRRKKGHSSHLKMLIPSGIRGFEHIQGDPESFVSDVCRQAEQLGFDWVILDIASEADTMLTISALRHVDVCVTIHDDRVIHRNLFRHRWNLLRNLGWTAPVIPVGVRLHPGKRRMRETEDVPEWEQPLVTFPYTRSSALFRILNLRYKRALKLLIRYIERTQRQTVAKGGGDGEHKHES